MLFLESGKMAWVLVVAASFEHISSEPSYYSLDLGMMGAYHHAFYVRLPTRRLALRTPFLISDSRYFSCLLPTLTLTLLDVYQRFEFFHFTSRSILLIHTKRRSMFIAKLEL
jgi:hypothetical protein